MLEKVETEEEEREIEISEPSRRALDRELVEEGGDRIFMKASIIQKGDSFVLFFWSSNIILATWDFEISPYTMVKMSHTPFARPIACARKTSYQLH